MGVWNVPYPLAVCSVPSSVGLPVHVGALLSAALDNSEQFLDAFVQSHLCILPIHDLKLLAQEHIVLFKKIFLSTHHLNAFNAQQEWQSAVMHAYTCICIFVALSIAEQNNTEHFLLEMNAATKNWGPQNSD